VDKLVYEFFRGASVNELRGFLQIQLWRKPTRRARGPEKEPTARDFQGMGGPDDGLHSGKQQEV
jgi:hypothetical protein